MFRCRKTSLFVLSYWAHPPTQIMWRSIFPWVPLAWRSTWSLPSVAWPSKCKCLLLIAHEYNGTIHSFFWFELPEVVCWMWCVPYPSTTWRQNTDLRQCHRVPGHLNCQPISRGARIFGKLCYCWPNEEWLDHATSTKSCQPHQYLLLPHRRCEYASNSWFVWSKTVAEVRLFSKSMNPCWGWGLSWGQ